MLLICGLYVNNAQNHCKSYDSFAQKVKLYKYSQNSVDNV